MQHALFQLFFKDPNIQATCNIIALKGPVEPRGQGGHFCLLDLLKAIAGITLLSSSLSSV